MLCASQVAEKEEILSLQPLTSNNFMGFPKLDMKKKTCNANLPSDSPAEISCKRPFSANQTVSWLKTFHVLNFSNFFVNFYLLILRELRMPFQGPVGSEKLVAQRKTHNNLFKRIRLCVHY